MTLVTVKTVKTKHDKWLNLFSLSAFLENLEKVPIFPGYFCTSTGASGVSRIHFKNKIAYSHASRKKISAKYNMPKAAMEKIYLLHKIQSMRKKSCSHATFSFLFCSFFPEINKIQVHWDFTFYTFSTAFPTEKDKISNGSHSFLQNFILFQLSYILFQKERITISRRKSLFLAKNFYTLSTQTIFCSCRKKELPKRKSFLVLNFQFPVNNIWAQAQKDSFTLGNYLLLTQTLFLHYLCEFYLCDLYFFTCAC